MACEIKLLQSEATTGFFVLLGEQGNKAVLDWVMKEGLIPSRYECPKCKKDMRLVERKGTMDGFEWRCRVQSKENPHFVCRSSTAVTTSVEGHDKLPLSKLHIKSELEFSSKDLLRTSDLEQKSHFNFLSAALAQTPANYVKTGRYG
ncbi:uncharacterized protein TNCV_280721 [Trichonephila clavipes]|nr:uncharacterized protein TNCV_280721 [Trichonephila clavipes]